MESLSDDHSRSVLWFGSGRFRIEPVSPPRPHYMDQNLKVEWKIPVFNAYEPLEATILDVKNVILLHFLINGTFTDSRETEFVGTPGKRIPVPWTASIT